MCFYIHLFLYGFYIVCFIADVGKVLNYMTISVFTGISIISLSKLLKYDCFLQIYMYL